MEPRCVLHQSARSSIEIVANETKQKNTYKFNVRNDSLTKKWHTNGYSSHPGVTPDSLGPKTPIFPPFEVANSKFLQNCNKTKAFDQSNRIESYVHRSFSFSYHCEM